MSHSLTNPREQVSLDDDAVPKKSMVYMAAAEEGNGLSLAAYNDETKQIILENCILSKEDHTYGIVEQALSVIRPSLVLVSNKVLTKPALLQAITTPTILNGTHPEQASLQTDTVVSIPYRVLKSSSFDGRNARTMILQKLRVAAVQHQQQEVSQRSHNGERRNFPLAINNHVRGVSNYHSLASIIDFESKAQIQAIGALVSFLHNTIFRTHEGGLVTVQNIIHAKAYAYMHLPSTTFTALHIFATEHHPLAPARGGGNAKEGFSLFSLMDRTKSRPGRQRLREWMLQPLLDLEAIQLRQDGVELFLCPEFQNAVGSILKLLEKVGPVDTVLGRIEKHCAKPNDFVTLTRTISAGIAIGLVLQQEILWNLQQRIDATFPTHKVSNEVNLATDPKPLAYSAFIQYILQRCNPTVLQETLDRLEAVIDQEATSAYQYVVIRTGCSPQLDQFKQQYSNLSVVLTDLSLSLAEQFPYLRDYEVHCTFIPQVGFLVGLQISHVRGGETNQVPDDFRFICKEQDVSFFKNQDTVQLDKDYGDLDSLIKDEENWIVAQLEDNIIETATDLRGTFQALAELDCILSFAICANDLNYSRPSLVPAQTCTIKIRNGRHPLQERTLDDFIPNDTYVDAENRVNIITGPNFSGKSCYARQVGLLVYMAHLGSFLPCDFAEISVTDHLFAQFSSIETCSVPQSSFQYALSQMGSILQRATATSLVLIDEFGKGTSPASGIALLTAALQELSKRGTKVMCTTHFLEIFSMALLRDEFDGVRALRMDVKIPESPDEVAMPLFKLERGVASSSAGLVCAKIAGVKQSVVKRAGEIIKATKERRKVEPLAEILHRHFGLDDKAEKLLKTFFSTNWTEADDDIVEFFWEQLNSL